VMALYTVLGFSFACYGLCYCIGFDSKDGVKRVNIFINKNLISLMIGLCYINNHVIYLYCIKNLQNSHKLS